jgi:CubicO group peptidase (beta-lactamase class C family)
MKLLKLLALTLLVGCQATTNEKRVRNPKYSPEIEERIDRVIANLQAETEFSEIYERKTLTGQMKKYHTPGVSIAVINDGKIEWARGFGIANEVTNDSVYTETLFEAGSVSKPTFALMVMKLKEKGIVDLDKDVNDYLKSWKIPAHENWQPGITLRQLLSHTAGLTVHGFPGYLKTDSIPTVPQLLSGKSPANTDEVKVNIMPGTAFRYSGGGTTVAQQTIIDVTGKSFPDLAREELFTPLKLKHSTYQQPLPDSLEKIASSAFPYKGVPIAGRYHVYPEMAAAGLWTNPTELALLAIEVQKALKGESSFYKKETIEEMLTPQKVAPNIGIGFFLNSQGDSARFGHGGWDEGFVTDFVAYKHLGKGAVVMVNSNEGYNLLNEIMQAIAIEYQWPDYLPQTQKPATTSMDEIKKLKGTYGNEQGQEFKVDEGDGTLLLTYQHQKPIPLIKSTENIFYDKQFNFQVSFNKDELTFKQMGNTKTFKKKMNPF